MKHEELIMLIHDDEVDAALAPQAETLARESGTQARLEELRLVGALVREVHGARASAPDLTEPILSHILAEGLARKGPARAGATRARPARPLWPFALVAAGLSMAAGLWLLVSSLEPKAPNVASLALPSVAPPRTLEPVLPVLGAQAAEPPVALESVDFGPTQGAIFLLSAGESDTLVVWTIEDANDKSRKVDL